MTRFRSFKLVPYAVVALLGLGSATVQAAFVSIDDTSANETITFSGGGFINFLQGSQYFFVINGQNYNANTFTTTFPENGVVTFSGTWGASAANSGTRTVYLVEDMATGAISDIVTLSWTVVGFNGSGAVTELSGTFRSDTETGLGFLTGNELAQDVFLESGPVTFSVSDLAFTISSDPEAQGSVPEPSSLLLLGTGLAAAARRWLKSRA